MAICLQLVGSGNLILVTPGSSNLTPGSRHFGQQKDPGIQDINHQCRLDIHPWEASLPIIQVDIPWLSSSRVASQLSSREALAHQWTSRVGKVNLHAALSPLSFLQSTGTILIPNP